MTDLAEDSVTHSLPGAQELRAAIPRLRRFGRAITGSQRAADASVLRIINSFVSDPLAVDPSNRIDLFAQLIRLLEDECGGSSDRNETRLPTPKARQAHLLVNVEELSKEAVAAILDTSISEVARMLASVEREIRTQPAGDVFIIEDEPFIALDLERIVTDLGHTVTGCAITHEEAVRGIKNRLPDLVLSDVQLADGSSGISAIDEILNFARVPVVFITAFPDRFLTGRRGEPIFLIAKPFRDACVRATLSQALHLDKRCADSNTY